MKFLLKFGSVLFMLIAIVLMVGAFYIFLDTFNADVMAVRFVIGGLLLAISYWFYERAEKIDNNEEE